MSLKSITCVSCNRGIQVPTDIPDPKCPYCGADQSITAAPATPDSNVSTLMGLAGTALAAGNPKEALEYYNRVLEVDPKNFEAWFGKGKAAGWQSTLGNIRLTEALVNFSHAIATAPESQKEQLMTLAVDESNRITTAIYKMGRKHMMEFVTVQKSWSQYIVQVAPAGRAKESRRLGAGK